MITGGIRIALSLLGSGTLPISILGCRDERSSTGKAGFASDVVDRYSAILYRLIPDIEPFLYQPNCLTFLSHHCYQLSFLVWTVNLFSTLGFSHQRIPLPGSSTLSFSISSTTLKSDNCLLIESIGTDFPFLTEAILFSCSVVHEIGSAFQSLKGGAYALSLNYRT